MLDFIFGSQADSVVGYFVASFLDIWLFTSKVATLSIMQLHMTPVKPVLLVGSLSTSFYVGI